ncbi:MAG: hypothetical protein PVJ49_03585 [Acidobacteriota bacterium]|jgi:hypothetical protein
MTSQESPPPRLRPWLAILVAFWGIGLFQSYQLTRAQTDHPDIYADIERYRPVREVFGDAPLAGFRTDHEAVRGLQRQRWLVQYAAMPTMLLPAFGDDAAMRMVRNRTTGGRTFHLVYTYRQRRNLRRFDSLLREHVEPLRCTIETVEPVESVVVYRLSGCTHD